MATRDRPVHVFVHVHSVPGLPLVYTFCDLKGARPAEGYPARDILGTARACQESKEPNTVPCSRYQPPPAHPPYPPQVRTFPPARAPTLVMAEYSAHYTSTARKSVGFELESVKSGQVKVRPG